MTPHPRPRLLAAILTTLLGMVLLTACGPSATPGVQPSASPVASSSTAAEGAFPREVTIPKQVVTAEQTITLEERPSSIVVLAPALTETVYAVGAGDQVKAVDKLSTYPPDAKTTDLDAFSPNVEAVAGMEPDLVLVSNDQGGIVGQLQKLKIPVVVLEAPADLEHAYAQFEQVGELTGHEQEAAELATSVQERIEAAVAAAKDTTAETYYWELDSSAHYSVTSETFVGSILGQFGLTSIADEAPDAAKSGGYPQLSAEFIIDADPDLIFAPGGDAAEIRSRDGWDVTRAVKDEAGVVVVDNDIASRWGPRIADLAEQIGAALQQVQ